MNLINNHPDIDKIYLYGKDPYLINKHEKVSLNRYDDPKAFIEYSNDMQDRKILKNNLEKKHKVLIVFDDMIVANMFNNKET